MDRVTDFEIPVDNLKRAEKFLKSVFGWKFDDWGGGAHAMTVEMDRNFVPKEKGAINGTLYKRHEKNERPALVVTVPSIDKYLSKVKKAKGTVVTGKTDAGEWGWWAEIKDTEGNVYEIWEEKK